MPNENHTSIKKVAFIFAITFLLTLVVFFGLFYTFRYMLNIILLTFLCTFIFYQLLSLVKRLAKKYRIPLLPDKFLIAIFYLAFILIMVYAFYRLSPIIAKQIKDLITIFENFDLTALAINLTPDYANVFIEKLHLNDLLTNLAQSLGSVATTVTGLTVDIVLALLLSLLILMEKDDLSAFGRALEKSSISGIYSQIVHFVSSFVSTFAQVMKVQVLIATINCIVSVIFLKFMGFGSILGLGVMIFLLGLIPVAGVIVSLIPLSIIAYNLGGIPKVLGIWVMIAVIHALESYVLNPKLMSNRTHLPVCIVFMILLIGEHYLGVWGLLIGVPLFIFFLEVLQINYQERK